jgi:tetratricopeptide (TPR) repeat protein/tRNA A-37 threonylcarbamoyl transferase component Bud32
MNTQPNPKPTCTRCGAILMDAAGGLCPRCLMAEAMQPTEQDAPANAAPTLTPEELAPHFPQLEIIKCLGRGGMGVVYKARQKSLNRLVALKLLAPERVMDAPFAERFAREAQALAALSHPNIVTVHEFGRTDGLYFLIMEFVDGVNLRQAMKGGRFTPEQALAVVPPVCEALQYAHEHGIVHRDIKPENLLLDKDGRIKIADFGIAKMLGECDTAVPAVPGSPTAGTAVSHSIPAGTPQYMAPEQRDQQRTDHRADIYSLGVVLYELLTGELPAGQLQRPSSKVQIDVRLDEIVLRALNEKPELRYQTAAEFRTQVESVATAPGHAEPLHSVHAWLALMDRGQYAESWEAASAWFRRVESKEAWTSKGNTVRLPVGAVLSRQLLTTRFAARETRFEARFKTDFEEFPNAVETVMFMREPDGAWKATGYLILPETDPAHWVPLAAFIAACLSGIIPTIFYWLGSILVPGISPGTRGTILMLTPVFAVLAVVLGMWRRRSGFSVSAIIVGSINLVIALLMMSSKATVPPAWGAALPDTSVQQAWQLWQSGRPADALPIFREAVKRTPNDANTWNGLGWSAFNSGNTDEAAAAFQKVLTLDANHMGALNGLGQIHLARREYDAAEPMLVKAAQQGAAASWYGLTRLYLLTGKFAEAEKWAQKLDDSGQADPVAKKMLEAAKAKTLSEGLRQTIEPPALPPK